MATFRKLPSGSWQVRIRRHGNNSVTKTFKTKAHAEKWARLVESEVDTGFFVDRSSLDALTLNDLIDRYLVEITPSKKSKNQEIKRLSFLKRELGTMVLSSIQAKDIAAYRDKRLKEGKAGGTVIKDINSLSHIFNIAIKDWGIPLPSNPAQMIRKPSAGRGRDRRLQDNELEKLLSALELSEIKPIVLLAIETAMRRSEITSLQWNNIHLDERFLIIQDTKNGEARTVPLSSKAVKILSALDRCSPNVFNIKSGSVTQAFKRACTRANLENLRFHDLRHEATSHFFELGLNTMEVSSITGHKSLQMLKRYTHLKAKELALKLG